MNRRFLPQLCFLCALLAGCAVSPPAPVHESARDVPVEEPEPVVRRPQAHTIQAGETLAEIALEYGLDHRELAEWNGIANPDRIYAGNVLRLSRPESAAVASAVVPRETAAINPVLSAAAPVISAESGTSAGAVVAPVVPQAGGAEGGGSRTTPRGNAPVKDGPAAAKYAYNKRTLDKLRAAHAAAETASFQKPDAADIAPSPSAAAPGASRRRFDVDWSWPTAGGLSRKFSEASKGIEIAGAKGDPIYAVADGKVVYTGGGIKSYGRLVILKHDNDYLSAYAHNDSILVKEGQKVARGEQISTVGDSGATKTMLHLEIRKSGKPFDPLQVLPAQP